MIRLLDEDPDLGEGLDPAERETAAGDLRVRVVTADQGPWLFGGIVAEEPGDLGLLVLGGFVVRTANIEGRRWADLLDQGDILRPWDPPDYGGALLDTHPEWTVLAGLRLAVLDRRFAAAAGQWPAVVENLLVRSLRHSRWLAALLAINSRPRVDERLHMLFHQLAGRWGRVTPDGILVNLPLTHELLSNIVCAQRPSVTSALTLLAEQGTLRRVDGRGWVLAGYGTSPPIPSS